MAILILYSVFVASMWGLSYAIYEGLIGESSGDPEVFLIGGVALFGYIYGLPGFIAFLRKHPSRWLILIVNWFLGTTVFAWILCLIWSLGKIYDPIALPGDKAGPARPPDSSIERLERLGALLEKGLVTQEEYETEKRKILGEG